MGGEGTVRPGETGGSGGFRNRVYGGGGGGNEGRGDGGGGGDTGMTGETVRQGWKVSHTAKLSTHAE